MEPTIIRLSYVYFIISWNVKAERYLKLSDLSVSLIIQMHKLRPQEVKSTVNENSPLQADLETINKMFLYST